MYDRREFLRLGLGTALGAVALPGVVWAGALQPTNSKRRITVYKTPTCECCARWIEHVKQTGWIIDVHNLDDVTAIKDKARVPQAVRTCHTALVGRYTFEGHVPADIMMAFMEKPKGVAGLAVPGMPIGSPGMEVPGRPADRYQILGFYRDGRTFVHASR
jgi:hypothetical protein